MSEYDDDDGPTPEEHEEEMAANAAALIDGAAREPAAGTFTATVSRGEIVAIVAARFYSDLVNQSNYRDGDGMTHAVREEIRRLVGSEIGEEIKRLAAAEVIDVVADLVARGWPKTDSYGRAAGTVTIRDLVVEHFTKADNYGNREPLISKLARETVEAAIKTELAPLIEQAKVKARAVLEESFAGALKRALLEGAGLR